ncbi:MAG: substrate-binding domain-containing protein [Dysgonomonas sp.]|nr:substrate-binding domain-containing protein [Dysgonomonas sp.]
MKKTAYRVALAIFVILLLAPFGLFIMLMMALNGEGEFYSIFITVTYVLLSVWMILLAVRKFSKKTRDYLLIGIVFVSLSTFMIYNGRKMYIESIPTVSDQGVDLFKYKPFTDSSQIARLDEPSTFQVQDSLIIDGATALYPLYAAFVEATFPRGDYNPYGGQVSCSTTPEAYSHLLYGDADLIFCAAPSKRQVEEAKNFGKEYKLTAIGKEAFVFFVNAENPVSELSVEQIQDIYSGKITNWKEVGGRNEEIKAFQRPHNSGSQTMLEKIMGEKPLMEPPRNNRVGGMGEIIDRTATYKNFGNAIGYTFLFFATEMIGNNQIKLIKVNGIEPSKETIRSGKYPFVGDFYAITTDTNNKNVEDFIHWILSPQGQELVEKTGYIPVNQLVN